MTFHHRATGHRLLPRRRALAAALVGATLLLAGCSGSGPSLPVATATGDRPTPSFTRPSEPEATSESAEPTQAPTKTTAEAEPTEDESTPEPTKPREEAAPATTAAPVPDAEPKSDSTGVPEWAAWLLAAALLALAIGVPLFVAARRRRSWTDRLDAATTEAIWFARELIPQLQQQGSAEQVAGGWHLARARVVAAEDSLTGLETAAPDPQRAERAHTLREAVRHARDQLDAATQPGASATVGFELVGAARTLEAALPAVDPTQPPAPPT